MIFETRKRKNDDDKPKGLPRRRLMGGLVAAALTVGVIAGGLIARSQQNAYGLTGHLFYNATSGAYDLNMETGERTSITFDEIPYAADMEANPVTRDEVWNVYWWGTQPNQQELMLYHRLSQESIPLTPEGLFSLGDAYMGWSPDEQWVVFAAIPTVNDVQTDSDSDIWRVNVKTGELQQLTDNTLIEMWPTVSPDGTKVAFTVKTDGFHRLHVMDLATHEVTPLTPNQIIHLYDWSPDSQWLAYMTEQQGGDVWIVKVDGSEAKAVAATSEYETGPIWLP